LKNPTQLLGTYNFGTYNPNFPFTFEQALYFAGGFSYPDAKYLPYQFVSIPSANNPDSTAFVRFGILRVHNNGNLTPVVEITSSTSTASVAARNSSFPIIMRRDHVKKNIYYLLTTATDVVIGNLTATEYSAIQMWKFNAETGSLKLLAEEQQPQTVIGFDFNYALDRIILTVRGDMATNTSVLLNPLPSQTSGPKRFSEFRLYEFDKCSNKKKIRFLAAADLRNRSGFPRFSHDDKNIALDSILIVGDSNEPGLPAPGLLVLYKFVKDESALVLRSFGIVSPSPIGIGWSPDDSLIGETGFPSEFQKDTTLWEIVENL
jgi:hypothetical protein